MDSNPFTLFGSHTPEGSYILVINLSAPAKLAFGRFMKGKLLALPEGDYLYIGSALGGRGRRNPLASRLIRHASRSGEKKPHAIRDAVTTLFGSSACKPGNKSAVSEKKLRWHIDYLLDTPEAEISHIFIIRSSMRLERTIWELLRNLEEISIPAHRLGAQDTLDSTHLIRLSHREIVLGILRDRIPAMLAEECPKEL
ncbi:MAG: DUF123 domain-containing protein [Chlorobiaceae bacterium]|nr:DUF123 domain-containing protein [Chlorobiaceae bacterium]NTW10857.1 DUF123 domain-containing protein [Chlorobiaceae bacterium]